MDILAQESEMFNIESLSVRGIVPIYFVQFDEHFSQNQTEVCSCHSSI